MTRMTRMTGTARRAQPPEEGASVIEEVLFAPFALGFMRRALAGCLALSLAGPPLGVFLVLRRMSLMSDVLQHGILPGIALAAILSGTSLLAMGVGGALAGLAVALLAGWLARATAAREDSQLAGAYLLALALGVALVSLHRGADLGHLLFGNVLAVDDAALIGMAGIATLVLPALALIWRPLILDSLDPTYLAQLGGHGAAWHLVFLALVVLCVVAGFVALGTLMSVGLMMLPAIAARHLAPTLAGQVRAAVGLALAASYGGLLLAYHADLPAGPAIVLVAGAVWLGLILAGPRESLLYRALRRPHLAG
jgi:zinc/manganese transport system permease protein